MPQAQHLAEYELIKLLDKLNTRETGISGVLYTKIGHVAHEGHKPTEAIAHQAFRL